MIPFFDEFFKFISFQEDESRSEYKDKFIRQLAGAWKCVTDNNSGA